MSCTINLYPDNSLLFEATVTNPNATPIYVNDATVVVTVFDTEGVEVTGQAWPLTLSYVAASDGIYRATAAPISGLQAKRTYSVILTATGTDSLVGQWDYETVASYRGCD